MSTNDVQGRLLGGPSGDSVSIATCGRTIRPALALPTALVDEARLHCHPDRIELTCIDAANVGLVDLTIHAAAFEDYHLDADEELTVGVRLDGLEAKCSNARLGKRTNDPVAIDLDETRSVVEIEREYANTTVRYADEVLNIDPDSIREQPELSALDLPATAEVDVDAFTDAIDHIDQSSDHVEMVAHGDALVLNGGGNDNSPVDYSSAVEFEGVLSGVDDRLAASYSLDYLTDIATALKKARVDNLWIDFNEEFPVDLRFVREIDESIGYEGHYRLAPRLSQDGDSP